MASHDLEVRYQNVTAPQLRKAAGDDDAELKRKVEEVIAAYELDAWTELVPLLQDGLATAGTEAAGIAFQAPAIAASGRITGSFGQVNNAAVDYAADRAAEMVGMRWVDGELVSNPNARWAITESTRDWLREATTEAFERGLSPEKFARVIGGSPAFSRARARMIAHTEVGNATVASQLEVAVAAGATHKRTFLSADHDDDDFCDAAAGEGEVPIDFDYGEGLYAPLFHPRCKCSISTYVRKLK